MSAAGAEEHDDRACGRAVPDAALAAASHAGVREQDDRPPRVVVVNGELAKSTGEWMYVDGNGAYASSTVALMHTRRDHGLLVAAHPPCNVPHVFVSHVDITLDIGGQSVSLATHQFPSVEPTHGYEHLAMFAQDPLPRWVFRGPGWELERTLGLVRHANAIVLRHAWHGPDRVVLEARPLLAMRPVSGLMHEHGGLVHRVWLHANTVAVQPVPMLPRIVFRFQGRFVGSPDWWRRFEYLGERAQGGVKEDLWTPGVFRVELQPGDTAYLVCGVGTAPEEAPARLLHDAREMDEPQRPGLANAGPAKHPGGTPVRAEPCSRRTPIVPWKTP